MVGNNVYSLSCVMVVVVVVVIPNLELIIELPARRSSMTFN